VSCPPARNELVSAGSRLASAQPDREGRKHESGQLSLIFQISPGRIFAFAGRIFAFGREYSVAFSQEGRMLRLPAVLVLCLLAGLSGCSGSQTNPRPTQGRSFPRPSDTGSSKYVGRWVGDFATNNGKMTLSADGSGYAAGGVWQMKTFRWKEEGDHAALIGWDDNYAYKTAKLSPDGEAMELSRPVYGNSSSVTLFKDKR